MKEWTLFLRKGVPFHFGYGEFTARDVVHTHSLMLRQDAIATFAGFWRGAEEIKVIDDYQVVTRGAPDVIIYEDSGDYKVRVENESLPKLRISPRYRELLDRSKDDPEIRKYIKRKIDNAEFLLHAIQQRGSTLHRVAEEIVKNQQEFFKSEPRFLRPLKMQQVADAVGVNVSTVSRAISGKYFQSPDYIKELK